jgi:hypothetical protein
MLYCRIFAHSLLLMPVMRFDANAQAACDRLLELWG